MKEEPLIRKVLFISYNGLLEPILSSQGVPYLKGLAEKGFEFVLLTYEKKPDIKRLNGGELKEIKDNLGSYGIEWRYLRYHKWPRLLAKLFDIFIGVLYCSYLIPTGNIKIVHVRGATPGTIMIILSKIFKVKILFDMRGRLAEEMAAGGLWKTGSLSFRLAKAAEKRLLEISDAVTVLTNKHLEFNKALDYFKNRQIPMEVIPCCVDISKFHCDERDSSELKKSLGLSGRFVLMYQGKIGTFYFLNKMLEFYKTMLEIVPNAVFFVVTADETDSVLRIAEALHLERDKIRFTRNVPYEKIPRYLSVADAGIFFINPYEKLGSSPIKMGEFLACGVPVVINPGVGDTEELARDNKVGVVVDNLKEDDYRIAAAELLRLKEEGSALRTRCRETASRHLSLEDGVNKYYKIYRKLI